MITRCRICDRPLFSDPLVRYENMPASAQYLPRRADLPRDQGVTLEVRQCSGCGLVQLATDPVPYFREVIRAAGISPEMRSFRRQQFGEFIDEFDLVDKKIVEIGCGHGEYLEIMDECGAKAYGLEYAAKGVNQCRTRGLEVHQGFIDKPEYQVPGAPFASFFMLNFLEHLPEPNAVLSGIHRNLEENGMGLIEVPNFEMILKKRLFTEFIPDHLFYFTRDTLAMTLSLNGFELIKCEPIWHDYILSAQIRKRQRLDLSQFNDKKLDLENELHDYLDRFSPTDVAIWGAGHQALATIAILELADKIRFVIDSAPFKQGHYTPATHIEIVSPDILDKTAIQAIVIMAASYSDEIAQIIKNHHGNRIEIAILRDSGLEIINR